MSELRFPSGPWTGYYTYQSASGKHGMDLTLAFADGRITGDGADAIGLFVIDGSYDVAGGECDWRKSYVGAHDVNYRGFREGKGIWGTWEIQHEWRGGFEIWPLGDVAAEELELEEAEPIGFDAPAPVTFQGFSESTVPPVFPAISIKVGRIYGPAKLCR